MSFIKTNIREIVKSRRNLSIFQVLFCLAWRLAVFSFIKNTKRKSLKTEKHKM